MRFVFLTAILAACGGANPAAPPATVYFVLDAPLCSSVVPVAFLIDNVPVGTDTFVVHIAGREHSMSRGFTTAAGSHTLSARMTDAAGFKWPDTSVTLDAGTAFTDSLPMYCS
jgi:hypothetical protein